MAGVLAPQDAQAKDQRNYQSPVREVKRLLHAVSMMDVDIDVTNTRVIFEQFQDGDDDIVDVAKSGGLKFLGMMKTAGPVHGDITALPGHEEEREGIREGQKGGGGGGGVGGAED